MNTVDIKPGTDSQLLLAKLIEAKRQRDEAKKAYNDILDEVKDRGLLEQGSEVEVLGQGKIQHQAVDRLSKSSLTKALIELEREDLCKTVADTKKVRAAAELDDAIADLVDEHTSVSSRWVVRPE